jgi:CCR4-NOT transcription complex subunit 9
LLLKKFVMASFCAVAGVMANLQPSLPVHPSFGGASPPSPSPIGGGAGAGPGGAAAAQEPNDRKMASAEQLVLELCDRELRENALLELSKVHLLLV